MQVRLRGTEAEIEAAIAKMETLLTVYERGQPTPTGDGELEIILGVQL